jgi:integrase/recombinase XerD
MDWKSSIRGFKAYLKLERGLSDNSLESYIRDVRKLVEFLEIKEKTVSPLQIQSRDVEEFLGYIHEIGLGARTQARMLSGIKAFYKYLLVEDLLDDDPTGLIEGPKLSRKIPDVLSLEEINALLGAIDLSSPLGHRNRAMIETLYACGLRVSELITLKISDFYPEEEYIKVTGKGNKERIVPMGEEAIQQNLYYMHHYRNELDIKPGCEDYLYLNRRGKNLTRVMIFTIVKNLVEYIGLKKNVSPHTFRHSFATHLVEGGANLRAVQDMLGHESITTTEIYTHIDRKYLRETILKFHPRNRVAQ